MTVDGRTCEKFGHQDECPEKEPVDCDLFSFCEFITTRNNQEKR